MATIEFDNVSKWYREAEPVVKNVSFHIRDKEFMVIVGPSGCGKSTMLRMIAGLEDISLGELRIDGVRVNEKAPKDRDIAMVFQNYALYPHMTVYENMAFGLKLRKMPKTEIRNRVFEAGNILGLADYMDRKPKELSGGQRQRVAVGRAIVRDPKVFLFDEPLSNLDAKMRVQTRAEISALHRKLQATMVYVTHDQIEAMTMGDRIVVMDSGNISQIDTPLNLYHHPVNIFVAGFIGSPSMNFIEGNLSSESGQFSAENLTGSILPRSSVKSVSPVSNQGAVTLGVRAEHMEITSPGTNGSITGVVEISEPLGNETYTYVKSGGKIIVARTYGSLIPEAGSTIALLPDPGKVHIFDRETGQNLVKQPV
ncbi:MAG: sn-glycerol-3-phosphate ABC transporter ATP-binding protein UgpC [Balneolaceae bacterium]|nr:MAG: sn-glycerol-3-phosphate ABC transporter ATP-binding protein UgpC [Balneolaceae bacterium]